MKALKALGEVMTIVEENRNIEITNKLHTSIKIFEQTPDNNSNNISTKDEKLLVML